MNETNAYIAGVFDADGTIGIKKSTYSVRVTGDSNQPTYSERVCLKQVEPQAVDLLHGLVGGYRFTAKPTAKKGRPLHGWQATDLKAAKFLKAILPYLRIKRAQAENCLELRKLKERSKKARIAKGRGHAGAASRPKEISDAMERLCEKAHKLNSVGI